jgi:pimeloyl-ACP methyl ester carboxylesterase
LWSSGPKLKTDVSVPEGEWMEEEGQRVRSTFWREAMTSDFLDLYQSLTCPVYMIFGSADHLISLEEMRAVEAACKNGDEIKVIEGLPHSAWPEPPRLSILKETRQRLESWFVERAG